MNKKVIDARIMAMRGRNANSLDSCNTHGGGRYHQRCELGGNTSNALTSVAKDNYVVEFYNEYMNKKTIYLGRINPENERHQQDRVFDCNGCSPTISAGETLGRYLTKIETNMMTTSTTKQLLELNGKKFRIRRLTPRECFRLMGVNDSDIDKIQSAGISNSNLYKLAGNSIVAGGNYKDSNGNLDGVLFNLFRKMFIDTEEPDNDGTPVQLTLF